MEPVSERFIDTDGESKTRTISIEEQIAMLSDFWKPVELIDDEKLKCEDGFIITPIPYDAGDHISYKYHKKADMQEVRREISLLKEQLSNGDYKIVKCYEANLLGEQLPYDMAKLHAERDEIRNRINELEKLLQ
ncbi:MULTISPECIES: hypothetical protein [unclassified Dysgonomonas]|uniref:hypothetical protein n=1 Tax=unclassified Dysgonomonas TaxID=2630389 RepID=UPI00247729D7|nr:MULTISPECIES: hypothetical protein [unclassified Dysgonomonas]